MTYCQVFQKLILVLDRPEKKLKVSKAQSNHVIF